MQTLDAFEERVQRLWQRLIPEMDDNEKRILLWYLRTGTATPYRIARLAHINTATVYRKAKKLVEKRVLLPIESNKGSLALSAKGCIALYTSRLITAGTLARCISDAWGFQVTAKELLGFLYLLGLEAEKRRLDLTSITICKFDEASIHVLRLLKDAILAHIRDGTGITEALDEIASGYGIPPDYLREGIQLALKSISKTLPLTIHTEHHKIILFVHGRLILPFVVECRKRCKHYRKSLGFDCPKAYRELQRYLAIAVQKKTC
ncbi:hypothetical protein Pyrde_1255 [Pyrodictium delaneyi]|uniref:Uncharacterized protein n=1 Tax=Pyrodictium delaneyi TaxID=1273541 RepID=A0A0P0N4K1_9CREN|nr:hypothetical protein [Pyrodictium delaneyi]ALL01303.1 hypothetical protein Pyrde_1255 [Pyrodictium delaneyi]OWJ53853.1 hypothetical protein Pdsh_10065 [Pyrodictium delaneyi]